LAEGRGEERRGVIGGLTSRRGRAGSRVSDGVSRGGAQSACSLGVGGGEVCGGAEVENGGRGDEVLALVVRPPSRLGGGSGRAQFFV